MKELQTHRCVEMAVQGIHDWTEFIDHFWYGSVVCNVTGESLHEVHQSNLDG